QTAVTKLDRRHPVEFSSQMRTIFAIICLAILNACAITSNVTPTWNGYLTVTAHGKLNAEFVSWTSVKDAAVASATAYCGSKRQHPRFVDMSTSGMMRLSND